MPAFRGKSSSWSGIRAGHTVGPGQEFVVVDLWAAVQEELVVFGIVDGFFVVGAGEGFDRFPGIPEGEEEKFALAVGDAAQGVDAAIAGRVGVFFQAGFEEVVVVGVLVGFADGAAPDAGDHGGRWSLVVGRWLRASSFELRASSFELRKIRRAALAIGGKKKRPLAEGVLLSPSPLGSEFLRSRFPASFVLAFTALSRKPEAQSLKPEA